MVRSIFKSRPSVTINSAKDKASADTSLAAGFCACLKLTGNDSSNTYNSRKRVRKYHSISHATPSRLKLQESLRAFLACKCMHLSKDTAACFNLRSMLG